MAVRILSLTVAICLAIGCIHVPPKPQPITQVTAPFERYISPNYDWGSVKRIVILPFANQVSAGYPRVGDEMRMSLATEMQRVGRFDIAVAPLEDNAVRAQDIFNTGQFNELELLRVAREHQADAVMVANVTQYHPYTPPRVGLSLVIISPTEGVAIASVSGMWDSREKNTADQIHSYYQKTQHFLSSLRGSDRVTDVPADFQRFVCQQVALGMVPNSSGLLVAPGTEMPGANPSGDYCPPGSPPGSATIQTGTMPAGAVPAGGYVPPANSLPPGIPTPIESMPLDGQFVPPRANGAAGF